MAITGILAATPMTVGVNEPVSIKLKLLGPLRRVPFCGFHLANSPAGGSPFSVNVGRNMHFLDNTLPEWTGCIAVDGGEALEGPKTIEFTGDNQGVWPGDTRPIRHCRGWRWTQPGLHWITLTDPESGISVLTNPVLVSELPPARRIYWGDIHWQSFFSDGLRCPEELYGFARDEAFLDFGAASDHAEGLTDRQWEYFVGVTNDFNDPGTFATLVGLEWTSMIYGHRNVYYRGTGGPLLRAGDARSDTLPKLWDCLAGLEAVVIPHHSANVIMGVNWEYGWNPAYEKAVEIHSVWGNSENSADDGNPQPIRACDGERKGQHVVDALRRGYRFGFVGAGDIHDGRPGDELHSHQETGGYTDLYRQGFTAAIVPALTREYLFDAIRQHDTYATTSTRLYLDVTLGAARMGSTVKREKNLPLHVLCAAPEPLQTAVLVKNGENLLTFSPGADPKVIKEQVQLQDLASGDFLYIRITTASGNMAWSSPIWVE